LGVFEAIGTDSHEEVLFGVDHAGGLRTITAIHTTALGPALGGTRFLPYSVERAAAMVDRIDDNVTTVFAAAERDGITPYRAAAVVGEERAASIETLNSKRRSVRSEP